MEKEREGEEIVYTSLRDGCGRFAPVRSRRLQKREKENNEGMQSAYVESSVRKCSCGVVR